MLLKFHERGYFNSRINNGLTPSIVALLKSALVAFVAATQLFLFIFLGCVRELHALHCFLFCTPLHALWSDTNQSHVANAKHTRQGLWHCCCSWIGCSGLQLPPAKLLRALVVCNSEGVLIALSHTRNEPGLQAHNQKKSKLTQPRRKHSLGCFEGNAEKPEQV